MIRPAIPPSAILLFVALLAGCGDRPATSPRARQAEAPTLEPAGRRATRSDRAAALRARQMADAARTMRALHALQAATQGAWPPGAPRFAPGGDHYWTSSFAAGNYNADNSAGYVYIPGTGAVTYGW